jgi:hypothetical protein
VPEGEEEKPAKRVRGSGGKNGNGIVDMTKSPKKGKGGGNKK